MKSDGEVVRGKPGERPAQPNQDRRQDRRPPRGQNPVRDQKRRDDQKRPPKPEKVAFNNPFAQLANWGKDDE
jgi:hypothetical protein